MKKTFIFFIFVIVVLTVLYYLTPYRIEFCGEKKIYYSIDSLVRNIEIANLSLEKTMITLESEDTEHIFEMKNLDLINYKYNSKKIIESMSFKLIAFKSIFGIYSKTPYIIMFDKERFDANVNAVAAKISKDAVSDIIKEERGFLRFIKGNRGVRVLKEEFARRIIDGLRKKELTVKIPVEFFDSVKKNNFDIKIPDVIISEFFTEFDYSNKSRVENLKVASEAIDNIIIKPDQKFSFNDFVGERTYKKGYKDAGVVVNGQIVDGIAGGICQVTSTFYNSALLAGIDIVKRYPHSIYDPEWAYTDRGLDSAVAYPYKDIIIKNNRNDNIMIDIEFIGNRLYCRLYANSKKDFEIELVTGKPHFIKFSTKTIYSDKLSKGTRKIVNPGIDGSIIESFRIFKYADGREKKEFLARDTYRKVDRVEMIGTN